MAITVKLFASLRDCLPAHADGNSFRHELGPGETVGEVLDSLGIPSDIKLLILLNSVHAVKETVLADGDTLAVFPPVAGG